MGRMQVGRFSNRAEAIDFLVTKFPLRDEERKQLDPSERDEAQYVVREREGQSALVFKHSRQLSNGKFGIAQYMGTGSDLSEAIVDLFKQLGVEKELEEVPNA